MTLFEECGLDFLMGNGICNEQTNNVICEFDGGDCCDPMSYYLCENCPCYPANTNEPECIFGPIICGNTIGVENSTVYPNHIIKHSIEPENAPTMIPKLIKPDNACDCIKVSLMMVCLIFIGVIISF